MEYVSNEVYSCLDITNPVKKAIGVGCDTRVIECAFDKKADLLKILGIKPFSTDSGFIPVNGLSPFYEALSDWGNDFYVALRKYGTLLAVLEKPELMFDFCLSWVEAESESAFVRGSVDGRNEASSKVCYGIFTMIENLEDCSFVKDRDVRVKKSVPFIHRTIQQYLSACFLIGLVTSAYMLGREGIVDSFKKYYNVECIVEVINEIKFPCI